MLLLMLANRLATCDHGSGKYDLSLALRLFIILTGQSLQIAKYFIPIVERYIDFKLSVVIFYLHYLFTKLEKVVLRSRSTSLKSPAF